MKKMTPANQLPLLPMTPENEVLFQANALTSAYYEMSALQKNIFYMVQSQLGANDAPDKGYVVKVKDIMAATDTVNIYKNLQIATESMMQKILNIPVNGNLLQVAPFSSVLYNYGEGTITLRIDSQLRPFLFNLDSKFTTLGKTEALNVSGKHTKRIYEMLSQWKSMGLMKITLLELKHRIKLYDPLTKEEQYPIWAEFKRRVLDLAVEEINEKTDLNVQFYTERENRKIYQLKWTIKVTKTHNLTPTPSDLHQRLITEFSLRTDQAQYIISHFDTVFIYKKLHEILIKNTSRRITNMGAYTAKVFGVI